MKLELLNEATIPPMLQSDDGGNSNNSNQGELVKVRRQPTEPGIALVQPPMCDLRVSIGIFDEVGHTFRTPGNYQDEKVNL